MTFLKCLPSVCTIGSDYEIILYGVANGIFSVKIGNAVYYEENSGVLASEKCFAKIRVPQDILDTVRFYTVRFRKTVDRKAYFSEMADEESVDFSFKPITKTENINIYHVADVHYCFDAGVNAATYFGDDLDLLVVNGDIGEVETEQNYFEVCKFVGDISHGNVPVIFVRGNHDTRGKLAERFTDYFPANGKNTFFDFKVGSLYGIALDCGEDKVDTNVEYNGVNAFEAFRQRESAYLRSLDKKDGLTFAISHICPSQAASKKDSVFDIEHDTYTAWNKELERLGVKFMLCGHIHKCYILQKNDEQSILPNAYAVIVGSALDHQTKEFIGAALTLSADKLTVKFTNDKKQVLSTQIIDLDTGKII